MEEIERAAKIAVWIVDRGFGSVAGYKLPS
jgi:hypothetical protein